jgi:hypothetical protein
MIKKIGLIYQTSKHLKFTQLFYQVCLRLKEKKKIDYYIPYNITSFEVSQLEFKFNVENNNQFLDNLTFCFLNKEKDFTTGVDWNFLEYGKLWNYNLQYLDFLHQTSLGTDRKDELLNSITTALLKNELKLEPYPVSLRTINTIKYYTETGKNDTFIIKGLYGQLAFLSKNLEFHLLGNHLLENGLALLLGGAYFNNKSWISKAERLLKKELAEQILEDGSHCELSPMYHLIIFYRVLELIDWYSSWEDHNPQSLEFFKETATNMHSWAKNILFENNEFPMLNDCTNGVSHSPQQLLEYFQFLQLKEKTIKLNTSGYRKIKNSSCEMVIDVANIGCSYQPGHGHSDALSFILYYKNRPVFVEAGTSTYEANETRYYERSTKAHNTVEVNSTNQSDVWDSFRVGNRAKVKIINQGSHFVIAEHDGYLKKFKLKHKRSIFLNNSKVFIEDELESILSQESKAFFHLYPNIDIKSIAKDTFELKDIGDIKFHGHSFINIDFFEYSIGFNKRVKSKVIIVDFDKSLKTHITFI